MAQLHSLLETSHRGPLRWLNQLQKPFDEGSVLRPLLKHGFQFFVLNIFLKLLVGLLNQSFFYHYLKVKLRDDTHNIFFSGRTTKGVGRVNSPDH